MKKPIVVALVVLFSISSYLMGNLFPVLTADNKKTAGVAAYYAGKATFCDLDENDRLKICPLRRHTTVFPDSGLAVEYKCSDKLGFLEVRDLSPKFEKQLAQELMQLTLMGVTVTPVCKAGEKGKVFKFSKKEKTI